MKVGDASGIILPISMHYARYQHGITPHASHFQKSTSYERIGRMFLSRSNIYTLNHLAYIRITPCVTDYLQTCSDALTIQALGITPIIQWELTLSRRITSSVLRAMPEIC